VNPLLAQIADSNAKRDAYQVPVLVAKLGDAIDPATLPGGIKAEGGGWVGSRYIAADALTPGGWRCTALRTADGGQVSVPQAAALVQSVWCLHCKGLIEYKPMAPGCVSDRGDGVHPKCMPAYLAGLRAAESKVHDVVDASGVSNKVRW